MSLLRFSEVNEADRLRFEAGVTRLGQRTARLAYSRAMNHTGRRAMTRVRRSIRAQSSIKAGDVRSQTRFHSASMSNLIIRLSAQGEYFPLIYFGARQFSYGVRAKVWGRMVQYRGLFIVNSIGQVFRNTRQFSPRSGRNNAIEKAWGPSVPREMLRDESMETWNDMQPDFAARVGHELERILAGR